MGPSGGMVDAGDSKSPAARRAGSSPALGTNTTEKPPKYIWNERLTKHQNIQVTSVIWLGQNTELK